MRQKNKSNTLERVLVKLIVTIMAFAVVGILALGFDSSVLQVTFYNMRSYKISEPIRVVLLADLHLSEFGFQNEDLMRKVTELEPDLIAVAGDLTIKGNPDHTVATTLLKNLNVIAPVYYGYGNHELSEILFEKDSTLKEDLKNTGAHILNLRYEKVNIHGEDLTIGGICIRPQDFSDTHRSFMADFSAQDGFKILLCHHPECYERVMEGYPVDLALAGHAHGGQIILPIVGGLYTPDQGFLPKLTDGMRTLCGSTVVISRGLGNSSEIPRYNNNPEIVVIDIGSY